MRRLFGPHTLLLATVAACSSFAGREGRVESGFDASTDASSDASDSGDALADAGTDQCVAFDGPGAPPGWKTDQAGGTVSFASFLNRNAFEAYVGKNGDNAQLLRKLTIPADGRFSVTVDLQTTAEHSTDLGWIVRLVTITCSYPESILQFALSPGGALYAEISPFASASGSATIVAPPPLSWSTLKLDVADDEITVSFADISKSLKIASMNSYAKQPICLIAVGASATANVPATTVHVARVCGVY